METIAPSRKHSFQWKPFLLAETVRFSVSCFLSFQWKSFLQRKSFAFSESNFFKWKLLVLIDEISFIGSYSFFWKPFILVEAIPFSFFPQSLCFWWKSLPAVETSLFRKILLFLVEAMSKLLLLIETFLFGGRHSCQCFNIFTSRNYPKLPEYININNSVRSLKMAHLLCIHIPREIFQSSKGYLEYSRASGVEKFGKIY